MTLTDWPSSLCWATGSSRPDMAELVNLQVERGQAKRYQVRQVVSLVRRYNLSLEE